MRTQCLGLLLLQAFAQLQVSVVSSGDWRRSIVSTGDDGGYSSPSSSWTTASTCAGPNSVCVWRFLDVQVPQGSTIRSASLEVSGVTGGLFCSSCGAEFAAEDSDNSAPLPSGSYNFLNYRDLVSSAVEVIVNGIALVDMKQHVQSVVTRPGWRYGNNFSIAAKLSCLFGTTNCVSLSLSPSFVSRLVITWTRTFTVSRSADDVLRPTAGNWQMLSPTLYRALDTRSLSIGVRNISITGTMESMVIRLETTGLITAGAGVYACKQNLPSIYFPTLNNVDHSCDLPCVAGNNYQLQFTNCWYLDTSPKFIRQLNVSHQFLTSTYCFQTVATGRIEFPSATIMNSTLLPFDGRPYDTHAGKMTSLTTSLFLNDRNSFLVTFGADKICVSASFLTVWLGNSTHKYLLRCALDSVVAAPPSDAEGDYKVVVCRFPTCNQSICVGGTPFFLTMNYSGTESRGYDTVMYPTLPVITKVQGCQDSFPRTVNCSTEGDTRINITMVEDPGWSTSVSVLVGGSACTSVFLYPFIVTCLLPPGVGQAQSVRVIVSGFLSPSVEYVSYGKPHILNLSGGIGCVLALDEVGVAVRMCNRDGSAAGAAITVTGSNFGPPDAAISITLNGIFVEVARNDTNPHGELYFMLPPGLGLRLKLIVTVGAQTDIAYVSYEPCPVGTDATCTPCGIGSYGTLPPQCVLCPPGRFQAAAGQSNCSFCPKGTFQPAPGRHDCVSCPPLMTSLGVGSSDIAACSACPVTHYLAEEGNDHVCTHCAPNSVPISTGGCGCNVGFFDNRVNVPESQKENLLCEICPPGANCELPGTQYTTMGPIRGWWRSRGGAFLRCVNDLDCLGTPWGFYSEGNATSSCAEHRAGALCAECELGYQSSSVQGGKCVPCDSDALAWLWVSLVLVFIAIAATGVGFWFHRRKKVREANLEDGSNKGSKTNSRVEHSRNSSLARSRATSEVVIAPPPEMLKRDSKIAIVATVKIMVGFLQILSSMTSTNVVLPSAFMLVMRKFAFLNFDFLPWASIRCVFNIDFYTRIYVGCLYPFAVVFLLLLFVALPIVFVDKRDFQDVGTARRFRAQFLNQTGTLVLFCLFLLYPWITLQLLQFGICLRVDENYFLMADMHEQCFVGQWLLHLGPVVALFMLLSVGIPVTLGVVLYRSRLNFRTDTVRERLGFLYQSYAGDCWWFELIEMSTKVALISIVRFFDPLIHAPLRMAVCYLYILVVLLKKPYVSSALDKLSLLCMAELLLFSLLAHVLPLVGRWQGTYIDDMLSTLLLVLCFALLVYVFFLAVKTTRLLFRHPWVRKMLTKSPDSINSRLQISPQFQQQQQQFSTSTLDDVDSLSCSQDVLEPVKEPVKPPRLQRPKTVATTQPILRGASRKSVESLIEDSSPTQVVG